VAWYPTPGQTGIPATLALKDTWTGWRGTYLFLGSAPTDQAAFAAALARYLTDPVCPNPAFVWIANPSDPSSLWNTSRIAVADGSTTGVADFSLRNLDVFVGATCSVALNGTQDGVTFTPPRAGFIYMTAMSGTAMLADVTSPLTLSFAGDAAGTLNFTLVLDNSGTAHASDLDRLDVGCRYFANDAAWLGYGLLTSWRYPVFDSASAPSLAVVASIDPLDPLDPNRTYFDLLPSPNASGHQLTSFYVNNMGYRLALTPVRPADGALTDTPRFVLAQRALTNPPCVTDPFYLTPAGTFAVSVLENGVPQPAAGAPLHRVVCGAAGSEYLGLATATGNLMTFFAGQPAYAAGYGSAATPGAQALGTLATTAWAYLNGPNASGLNYYAQPEDASLYQHLEDPQFLDFLEMSAGTLPGAVSLTSNPPTMFPMVPFAGIQTRGRDAYTSADDFAHLERQVLSPLRRRIVVALASATLGSSNTTLYGGTPQGILAELEVKSGAPLSITYTIARSGGGTQTLGFANVKSSNDDSGALGAALQSNQLFLVASDKAALQNCATLMGSVLTISSQASDTWTFNVFDDWNEHNSILILKFAGKSLSDLAADSTTWAAGAILNKTAGVGTVQSQIAQIIADAQTMAKTEPDFAYFANTVASDPGWNGILVLRCTVPLDKLPDQIAGIAAGIQPSAFYAHHLGVTMTPLGVDNDNVALTGDSSLFGLIYYDDPANLVPNGQPYQFKVLSLAVLFWNSTVVSFASRIEVYAQEMFGEPASAPDSGYGENNILLIGTYQKQDGHGTYLFLNAQDVVYTVDSRVLDTVEIDRAQFVTVVAPDQVKPPNPAESSLVLSGTLRFKALDGFDAFSFGDDAATDFTGGLSYSSLAIDMAYVPTDGTGPPPAKTFTFDATKMTFDLTSSKARPTSLYHGFPLTLTGFVQVDKGNNATPSSLGYLSIDAPVGQSSIAAPWFGLVFELNLGTAGALAAKAGFSSNVLAAWAPNPNAPTVGLGLTLPGAGGPQKLLSLESVLKLKIQRIAFMLNNGEYILNLNNIKLAILMLTFPPNGQTNAFLFGDSSGADYTTLAWYAGYAKNPKKGGN